MSTQMQVSTPTDTQILITREFAAPRHLVYRAFTEPELLRRWWHANRAKVTSIEMDVRVGGTYRWAAIADGGYEMEFWGEYREVVPDELLVSTETFSGAPEHPALNRTSFTEKDGRTYLELLIEHQDTTSRDMQLASGMEYGLADALVLVEAIARELAAAV
ncbi:MAG TPA: SRPBCC family protein [Actinospica sp.]|nr:SRPBCC family protein [Actinospica sp.]